MDDPHLNRIRRGQAMVELALILPLFLMVVVGIITLGIGVFYQQQVTNAAREAARYAAIHSATAQCPTVSRLNPKSAFIPESYTRCDRPEDSWPAMTAESRLKVFGLPPAQVRIAACWSGYVEGGSPDAPPPNPAPGGYDLAGTGVLTPVDSTWSPCSIDGKDPSSQPEAIGCAANVHTTTVDTASALSEKAGVIVANQVTAYACFNWQPPMAGFLLIPQTVILRGVISEAIQRQQ